MHNTARKLNLWYRSKVPVWQKLFTFVGAVVAAFSLATLGGYPPLIGVVVTAVVLIFTHLSITYYGLFPVLIIWLINVLAIPSLMWSLAVSVAPEEQLSVIVLIPASLLLTSLLWTWISYKYSSGKLWLTLAFIFSLQIISTIIFTIILGWWQWATLIAVISGGVAFSMRYYAVSWWRKKKIMRRNDGQSTSHYQLLPPMQDTKRKKLIDELEKIKDITVASYGDNESPTVLITKRGIITLFFYAPQESIDFSGKHGPKYRKNPLSPFAALLLKKTGLAAQGARKPYTVLVVDDNAIKQKAFKMDVMSAESKMEGSVFVTHPLLLSRTIKQIPVVSLTKGEINKVIANAKNDY